MITINFNQYLEFYIKADYVIKKNNIYSIFPVKYKQFNV